jgi:hypothetical protein
VFVFIPGSGGTTNITIVGQVMASSTNFTVYPSQFQLASYPWPVSGFLTTNLGYAGNQPVGSVKDKVIQWSPSSQTFVTHQYSGSAWSAGTPNISVAESFFLVPNKSTTWTNAFNLH